MERLLQWKNIVTYSDFVFVALGIHHANRMRSIFTRGLGESSIIFHII
jgi:hypothetical protein